MVFNGFNIKNIENSTAVPILYVSTYKSDKYRNEYIDFA